MRKRFVSGVGSAAAIVLFTGTVFVPAAGAASDNIVVAIDPGHTSVSHADEIDPVTGVKMSSTSNGQEDDDVFYVAEKVRNELESDGFEVVMLKETIDEDMTFRERVDRAADADADIGISIHTTPGNANTGEVYNQFVGGERYSPDKSTVVTFDNEETAEKSTEYSEIMAEARQEVEGTTVEMTKNSFDGRESEGKWGGDLPVVSLLSEEVPWTYHEFTNEDGQGGVQGIDGSSPGNERPNADRYAEGLIAGVKSVFGEGADSGSEDDEVTDSKDEGVDSDSTTSSTKAESPSDSSSGALSASGSGKSSSSADQSEADAPAIDQTPRATSTKEEKASAAPAKKNVKNGDVVSTRVEGNRTYITTARKSSGGSTSGSSGSGGSARTTTEPTSGRSSGSDSDSSKSNDSNEPREDTRSSDSADSGGGDLQESIYAAAEDAISAADADGITMDVVVGDASSGNRTGDAGKKVYPASVIKIAVAAAALKDGAVDAGDSDLAAMITKSDNEATNRIVEKVGGMDKVNDLSKGVIGSGEDITMANLMMSGSFDSTANAGGMASLLQEIYDSSTGKGDLLEKDKAQAIIDLMKQQQVATKLGKGLSVGTQLANKTGEFAEAGVSHDVGYLFSGDKVYTIAVFTSFSPGQDGFDKANGHIVSLSNDIAGLL